MNNHMPLVSCIMPTANRPQFVPYAISYFQRQTYANSELVIVDDGENSIEHLIPKHDPRIRYEKIAGKLLTGEKRNYACNASKGEIIVHWDDDDWYAANWVEYQVDTLLKSQADICGLSRLLFYSPSTKKGWQYVYPAHDRPWVAGASMCYHKHFWQQSPFKNVSVGEDNMFAWDNNPKIFQHSYIEGLIALVHPQNTSPKVINDSRWRRIIESIVSDIMKDDFNNYNG